MAAAAEDSGFNEDGDFDEYNPHPYQGGYDIALNYGAPLPPSTAICYPLSSESSPELYSPKPKSPKPKSPEPQSTKPQSPEPYSPKPKSPEPQWTKPHSPEPYSPQPKSPEPHSPEPYLPDYFGEWPFFTREDEERACWRDGSGEVGYWNQWRRAADYLFGYSMGYGERRIGLDSYGIPIYANKKHVGLPLVVQVEPARSQKLDFYEPIHSETRPLSPAEMKDESDYCQVQLDPVEPAWYQNSSYNEVYEEPVESQPNWSLSHKGMGDEMHFFATPNYAYDKHWHEEPLHFQVEPMVPALSHMSYYNAYEGHVSSDTNWHSSSNEPLEPFEPTWSQNLNQYGVYSEELSPDSTWHSPSGDESLEPFKPSWSCNPSCYEVYEEELSPDSRWLSPSHGDGGDGNHVFNNQSVAYERYYHEQPLSLQLAPFEPTWRQNSMNHDIYKDKGDEPLEEIATQLFFPFQKYSGHDG